ncbi:MAG: DUF3365 domain-containing protein [FCB group bacterium]|nr:DUF3365 domain-containing protein [FCB group bacterium]
MPQPIDDTKTLKAFHRLPLAWVGFLLIVIWTMFFVWDNVSHRGTMKLLTMRNIHNRAAMGIENVIIFRRWNALHGGVFVPINDYGVPNPYLKGLVERDLATTHGDSLTMINPAYMTRQYFDLLEKDTRFRGHITSLRPIRPKNAPDSWERQALESFEKGSTEASVITELDSTSYFRLMRPLVTEKPCLKCHQQQGYKEGDIRGGLSISIPIAGPLALMNQDIHRRTLFDLIVWMLGVAGILIGFSKLDKADHYRLEMLHRLMKLKRKTDRLNRELEETNALKLMLIDTMTHDLRKPLQVISGFSELALDSYPDDPYITRIDQNVTRVFETLNDVTILAQTALGESIPLEEVDLVPIVQEVSGEFTNLLEAEQLSLKMDIPQRCIVKAHPVIREVFRNYLSNAVKYAADGKQVDITIEETAKTVTIRIRDYGSTQIPEEKYPELFTRHFQDDEIHHGRGLGLFIVAQIAKVLNGKAWVEPNRPQGNVFAFSIPRNPRE